MHFRNYRSYFILSIVILFLCFPSKVHSKDNTCDKKIVYLTFDDGPDNIVTDKMLDILKKENVKATFFLIGYKVEGREQIIQRIKDEGHSIGLHTFSHNYKKIYKDNNCFIEEMNMCSQAIEKVTGISTKIIRFPTGSKGHMNQELLNSLHSLGYKIFDWNICLSDGINHNISPEKLYSEGTKKCINPKRVFLLAHCSGENKNTCIALPKIIKHYKNMGYEFKAIQNNTPEYYFRVSR